MSKVIVFIIYKHFCKNWYWWIKHLGTYQTIFQYERIFFTKAKK